MAVLQTDIIYKLENSELYFATLLHNNLQASQLGLVSDNNNRISNIYYLIYGLRTRVDTNVYDNTTINLYENLCREVPFLITPGVFANLNYLDININSQFQTVSYIINQNTSSQDAKFWIGGVGRAFKLISDIAPSNSTDVLRLSDTTIYQPTLISESNIKTINSTSLLGSTNILLQTPLIAGTDYLTPSGANSTYVPLSRTLTINGTTLDLSANRSWTINSMVYPTTGIAISTGTAWGTSIADNSTNWNTAYSSRISSLSTTGTSGVATLVSNILNIPVYQSQLSGSGYTKFSGTTPTYVTTIPNSDLTNSSITINGINIALGASGSISIGSGTVTSLTDNVVNGISLTWTNRTTTPIPTIVLGDITPTSTNGVSAATMIFNDATSSIQGQLNSKQAALGFTPENITNKTATASSSTTTYPNWLGITNNTLSQSTRYKLPVQVGFTKGPIPDTSLAESVYCAVQGKYCYVASRTAAAITVFDVSDPTNPVYITAVTGPVPGTSVVANVVKISGGYMYVACTEDGSTRLGNRLAILDLQDPANPYWISECLGTTPGVSLVGATGMEVVGNYVFMSNNDRGSLAVIDVTNPLVPIQVAELLGFTGPTNGMVINGKYLYITDERANALFIVDISNPLVPTIVKEYQGPVPGTSLQGAHTIDISGKYVYIGSTFSLSIVDVSNPLSPVWVSQIIPPGDVLDAATGISVTDGIAYMTAQSYGNLVLIDISNPASPTYITSLNIPASMVTIVGNYAYICSFWNNCLTIVDISQVNIVNANIGNLNVKSLQVEKELLVGGLLSVKEGLNVGYGVFSGGDIVGKTIKRQDGTGLNVLIDNGTIATINSGLTLASNSINLGGDLLKNTQIVLNGFTLTLGGNYGNSQLYIDPAGAFSGFVSDPSDNNLAGFTFDLTGLYVNDQIQNRGFINGDDYEANFVARSLTTVQYLKSLNLSQFASTTSAQLASVISNETGTGSLVFGTSPTLVTPALGTPSTLVGTNITGTGASFTAGNATKLATARTIAGTSFDGSANISLANKFIVQGTSDAGLSGAQFLGALATGVVKNTTSTGVLSIAVANTDYLPVTSPVMVTPTLGVAAGTSFNKVIITAPATSATLTLANSSTLTLNGGFNTQFTGSANATFTLPSASQTLASLAGTETLTNKTLTSPVINIGSDATGDIYYRNSSGILARLGIGSSTNVLTVSGGVPTWSASSGLTNPMTTLGDLIYGGATGPGAVTRLAGQTTINRAFLSQVQVGGAATAPLWFDLLGTSNSWGGTQGFNNINVGGNILTNVLQVGTGLGGQNIQFLDAAGTFKWHLSNNVGSPTDQIQWIYNGFIMSSLTSTGGPAFAALASGTTAPTTSGTLVNIVSDSNGLISFSGLPIKGNSTTTGTATTAVTVTIGSTLANSTYVVSIIARDLLTAVNYYISAQTTTTFTVTFVTALTGSINFDWVINQ